MGSPKQILDYAQPQQVVPASQVLARLITAVIATALGLLGVPCIVLGIVFAVGSEISGDSAGFFIWAIIASAGGVVLIALSIGIFRDFILARPSG